MHGETVKFVSLLCLLRVVQVAASETSWSPVQRSPACVCVCVCVCVIACSIGTSTMRWNIPDLECCAIEKNVRLWSLIILSTLWRIKPTRHNPLHNNILLSRISLHSAYLSDEQCYEDVWLHRRSLPNKSTATFLFWSLYRLDLDHYSTRLWTWGCVTIVGWLSVPFA
jgi:hypothetical protein